jgi:hypothetical protein
MPQCTPTEHNNKKNDGQKVFLPKLIMRWKNLAEREVNVQEEKR